MTVFRARWLILNSTLAVLLALAFLRGWGQLPFERDTTYITHAIAVASLIGLYFTFAGKWDTSQFIAEKLVLMGIFGTVVGFFISLSGFSQEATQQADAAVAMIGHMVAGFRTAMAATIAGIVGFAWLELNYHLLGRSS